ncbi:hypothetical protein K8354_02565 [Polaribacter litorisediminis]|uniref:hypothetical protein n=1 Tax=Polaribacter litorisediminis TaxID=1908341 RepID=UPI001CBE43D1|nr:hypothetical protein [Polaribacter litorisediminis]UAM98727.1 hypothetical protein K8354_02565 [Polaribacter litorisediminis]
MKTLKKISLLFVFMAVLFGCTEGESQLFIADLSSDEIAFQNTFAATYLLSEETKDNIADRFIWNEVTTITNNNYELEASAFSDFLTYTSIGRTNTNNHIVLVGQLLDLAGQLNLDNDPTTTYTNGDPNNSGVVYFRIRASIGNGGAGSEEIVSEIQPINISILEQVLDSGECNSIYVLGDATSDIGWNFPGAEVTCNQDILQVKLKLDSGFMNFFTIPGDWDSVLDYNYFENDGYAIDANFENTGNSFKFIGTPGIYTITIDQIAKTIDLMESSALWAVGGAVPGGWGFNADTVEFIENTPNIWSASITLSNDIFRFFDTFNTWDTNNNMTYYEEEGYTIDSNFENDGTGDGNFNFVGTPGTYTLTINAIDKTITLN